MRIAIFDADNPSKFLVLAEADDPENWKLPGGKFDSVDEAPLAAAERELGEELGLTGEGISLQHAGTLTNDDGISARHIFSAHARTSQPKPSAEIAAVRWASEDSVPEGPNKHHILSAVAAVRRFAR